MIKKSYNEKKYSTRNPVKRYLLNMFYKKILRVIYEINPKNILDVGCGEGYMSERIFKQFPDSHITGIDINSEAIKIAKSRCSDVRFQVEDIYAIPFDTNSFDLVICSEVLEHIKDPSIALNEISRVSSKRVLLTVPHEPWFWLLNLLSLNHLYTFGNVPDHINHWTVKKFSNFICSKLNIVEVKLSLPWIIAHGENKKNTDDKYPK